MGLLGCQNYLEYWSKFSIHNAELITMIRYISRKHRVSKLKLSIMSMIEFALLSQCYLDLVTLNLVTTYDLVAIFQKTILQLYYNTRMPASQAFAYNWGSLRL